MTRLTVIAASAALAFLTLPGTAEAHCPAIQAGSATVSCEQGVRVIRQAPITPQSLSPAQVAQIKLQRQRLAAQQREAARLARLETRRLDLERERVRNEGYLYRDANSPLRQRSQPQGFGTRGVRTAPGVVIAPGR
ncbi:MAG: hypothetical protein WBA35_09465 [Litorimonas sp.]